MFQIYYMKPIVDNIFHFELKYSRLQLLKMYVKLSLAPLIPSFSQVWPVHPSSFPFTSQKAILF